MTAVALRTARCAECGGEIMYEPVFWNGVEFSGPTICDPCGDADDRRREDTRNRERTAELVLLSGIPRRLRRVEWPAGNTPAIDAARRFAAGEIRGLFLCGDVGVGKTHLAACAALDLMRHTSDHRGRRVSWIDVAGTIRDLRPGADDLDKADAMRAISGRGAAVLDDIDKAGTTDFAKEQLYAAVNDRYNADAPLLITSNLPPGELAKRYGAHGRAIASRLHEHCELVLIEGPDRRRKRR